MTNFAIPEWLAAIVALTGVAQTARGKRSCWVINIIASLLYLVIFWQSNLFFQSILQVLYISLAIYGYFNWSGGDENFRTYSLPLKTHLFLILIFASIDVLLLRYFLKPSSMISLLDLSITIFCILAVLLTAWKIVESWIYWIILDTISASLFFSQHLYSTALVYLIYTGVAYAGWKHWRQLKTE